MNTVRFHIYKLQRLQGIYRDFCNTYKIIKDSDIDTFYIVQPVASCDKCLIVGVKQQYC